MAHTYEEVQQIACELPPDQRILLANSLWEGVEREEFDASKLKSMRPGKWRLDAGLPRLRPEAP